NNRTKYTPGIHGISNKTNPQLTKECWLCFNMRPPFYETISVPWEAECVNGTNPAQCLWRKGKDTTIGLTLSQITGKRRCIG
ncbi:ENV2 protein, partial [Pycnonotus jocosus]|nr:ENV2 protein [Pycnonotus jocosus]